LKDKKKWYQLNDSAISNLVVVLVGIAFYLALSNFSVLWSKISVFLSIISPFIVGFIIAYLLNAPVDFFHRKVFYKLKKGRGLSVLTIYVIAFLVLVILLMMIGPNVAESIKVLFTNMPVYLENLNTLVQSLTEQFNIENDAGINDLLITYQDLMERLANELTNAIPQILDLGRAIGSGVITAITAIISSIYMLLSKKQLVPQVKKLTYAILPVKQADWLTRVLHNANHIFLRFINGKIIDSAIIGVLCFTLCVFLQVPFPVLIGVVIGVTNVIPFFGPFIGAIPCLMILVIVEPWAALKFLILIIALQQFDGNILGPKILGDSTGLSALWVLVAIIVGGGLFGFIGMLLGVPVFAVIYALVRDWVEKRLKEKNITLSEPVKQEQPPEPE